jgi:capsular exopolysaccharide synthesis family protein
MEGLSLALEAGMPEAPSGPPRKLYVALAFLGAFFLGVCTLLVRELVDTKLQSDEDIQESLGLPVLGRVGGYAKELSAFLATPDTKGGNFLKSVSEATRESIKSLAMNTQFASLGKPMQTLVVTSTIPNEGKSTIAALLAIALAGGRKRVLLIDMDFRNPTVSKLMKMHNQVDLIDYIYNQKPLEEVVVKTVSGVYFIDNVHAVANASNIFNAAGFKLFLAEAKARFDMIIFDAPPLGLLVDAAVLATKVDYTLLVIGSGLPDKAEVKLVAEQLRLASANVLGVVLNFVKDSKRRSAYYYRRKGNYSKYYHDRKFL